MPWSSETFLEQYPHLAERLGRRRDALTTAALADAARYVDATIWGTRTDAGVGLMTAHLLELLPAADGTQSKSVHVVNGIQRTPWLDQFENMERRIGRANRIVLGGD